MKMTVHNNTRQVTLETEVDKDLYYLGRIAARFKVSAYGDKPKHVDLDVDKVIEKLAE